MAVAEARAEAKARNSNNELELARLRIEMEGMRNDLSARETALARAGLEVEQLRERTRRDGSDNLKAAEQAWSAEEAVRLAAAQTQWQAKSNIALSELRARLEATEAELALVKRSPAASAGNDHELRRLRDEMRGAHAIIASSETALKHAQKSEDALKSVRDAEAALRREKADWIAEADARFASAEAQWQK